MAVKTHFTVTIPAIPNHVGGTITCTEPEPLVYLLTMDSPPDNRLTPAFCAAMLEALDRVEFALATAPRGVLVTTSAQPKFYSNGLDLQLALGTPHFTENSLYPVFRRLLTFPLPTVALVNGHAFAGGLMLAMHHDYRVFGGGDRGYLSVNELEFGAPLMPPMAGIFRVKLAAPVLRTLVLEAKRWTAPDALAAGLLDRLDGWDGVMALVRDRALVEKGKSGVYGLLKKEMYREQVALLDARGTEAFMAQSIMADEAKRKKEGLAKFKESKL